MTTLPSPPTELWSPRNELATSRAVSRRFNIALSCSNLSNTVYQSSGGGSCRYEDDSE